MERSTLKSILSLVGGSATVVSGTYALDVLFLRANQRLKPTDAAFLEGIVFVMLGITFFLGSGGINRASRRDRSIGNVIGPSEILRRDAWKPEGHTLTAMILILSGASLIAVYFVDLHFS